ncbi:hypothetical protein BH10CHL1_BH10CHL1_10180 [soil metagenome]
MQPYQKTLTQRENDVLIALMNGSTTYAEIADDMGINARSVQTHLNNIFKTLGVRNMIELVVWCVRNGYEIEQKRQKT